MGHRPPAPPGPPGPSLIGSPLACRGRRHHDWRLRRGGPWRQPGGRHGRARRVRAGKPFAVCPKFVATRAGSPRTPRPLAAPAAGLGKQRRHSRTIYNLHTRTRAPTFTGVPHSSFFTPLCPALPHFSVVSPLARPTSTSISHALHPPFPPKKTHTHSDRRSGGGVSVKG